MKNKTYAMLLVVMVIGIIGCTSVKTALPNTNYGYSLAAQTKSNLKISDDIFDILRSPLGRPLQENMQPLSRKTWEYYVVAFTGADLAYVKNVLKWDMSEGSYEKQHGTDMLEIHDVKNNRVNSVQLIWKSKNFSEIDAIRKKFIDMAEKKFGGAGLWSENPDALCIMWSDRWTDRIIQYYVYSITKHEDGNYILLVYSLELNKSGFRHLFQDAPDEFTSFLEGLLF